MNTNNLRYAFGDWYEFTRQPCFVCGHTGHCLVNKDGKTVACTREQSDIVFSTRNPSWIHRLDEKQKIKINTKALEKSREKLPDNVLHQIYSALINHPQTQLTDEHLEHLTKERGLSIETIKARGYCSYPEKGWEVAKDVLGPLAERLADPKMTMGVPGFFVNEYGWTMPKNKGILVPYRNENGYIVGFQIRVDKPLNIVSVDTKGYEGLQAVVKEQPGLVQILDEGEIIGEYQLQLGQKVEVKRNGKVGYVELKKGQKYFWLSSSNRKYGAGAGAPVHVSIPAKELAAFLHESNLSDFETVIKKDTVWLTEGAMKGDIAVEHIGKAFKDVLNQVGDTMICVAGVGQWRNILPVLKAMEVKRINISYDMDVITNEQVKHHYKEMVEEFVKHFEVYVALWSPERAKGIDDILNLAIKPKLQLISRHSS